MTRVHYISEKYKNDRIVNDWFNDIPSKKKAHKSNGRIRAFLVGFTIAVVGSHLFYSSLPSAELTEAERATIAYEFLTNGMDSDKTKPVITPLRKPR